MQYQAKLDHALSRTYDLNNPQGLKLRYVLNEHGQPVDLLSGHAPVTGYELVRRMELAYAMIKQLEAGIAEHRRLLGDAMGDAVARQHKAEAIGEDPQ